MGVDPLTTGLLIAGTVLSAAGTAYTAYQQSKAEDYNAEVAEANAKAAENKAKYDADLHRERVRKLLSTQRSLYGASGVEMSGTPLLALEDTVVQGERDALAIRYGGDVEAARARSEATLYKQKAKSTRMAGYAQAGSSLLTGAGQIKGSM